MRYGETARAIAEFTDDRAFEKLAAILLTRTGMNLRPGGGAKDPGRDAAPGLREIRGQGLGAG